MDNRILIVADRLRERLNDPNWVFVDCRSDLADPGAGRRAYATSHIPGAVFLDLEEGLSGPIGPGTGRHPLPEVDAVVARLGELGIDKTRTVAVYDANHGAIAARAWWVLRWLGHDDVRLLDGGFDRWRQLGLPVEAGEVSREARTFQAQVRSELVLTTAQLADDPDGIRSLNLLDARDRGRFRGEYEPIDPVAGHVPGSVSMPFAEFVLPDGTWRPLPERKALLMSVLGGSAETKWAVMCGSGVTACHLAISGLEAGLAEPRLYVGSWSEWIRDPSRPVGAGDA